MRSRSWLQRGWLLRNNHALNKLKGIEAALIFSANMHKWLVIFMGKKNKKNMYKAYVEGWITSLNCDVKQKHKAWPICINLVSYKVSHGNHCCNYFMHNLFVTKYALGITNGTYNITVLIRNRKHIIRVKPTPSYWLHWLVNSSMPNETMPSFVQIMGCRLFGAKPLSEPILTYFETNFTEICMKTW